jgi:hypothetical protein
MFALPSGVDRVGLAAGQFHTGLVAAVSSMIDASGYATGQAGDKKNCAMCGRSLKERLHIANKP